MRKLLHDIESESIIFNFDCVVMKEYNTDNVAKDRIILKRHHYFILVNVHYCCRFPICSGFSQEREKS